MLSNKNFIIQLKSFSAVPPYASLMLFKVRWCYLQCTGQCSFQTVALWHCRTFSGNAAL